MRISDWSSDVCSSDLRRVGRAEIDGSVGRHVCRDKRAARIAARKKGRESSVPGVECKRTPGQAACISPASFAISAAARKSVVLGKSVSVRVDHGGGRIMKNTTRNGDNE